MYRGHVNAPNPEYICDNCQRSLGSRYERLHQQGAAKELYTLEDGTILCRRCFCQMNRRYKLYTLGYTGLKPETILAAAEYLNALIVDIRISPLSRVPHWNQAHLRQVRG